MKEGERNTRVWRNPFSQQIEIILETPLGKSGSHIGGVAKIEKGEVKWFPDIDQRLQAAGVGREDIVEDLRVLAAADRKRKQPRLQR